MNLKVKIEKERAEFAAKAKLFKEQVDTYLEQLSPDALLSDENEHIKEWVRLLDETLAWYYKRVSEVYSLIAP